MNFQLLNSVEHQQLIREEDNNKGSVFTLCLEHIMPHYRFLSLPSPTISHCRATSFKSVVFALKCLDRQVKEKCGELLTESLTTPKIMFTFPVCVSSRQWLLSVLLIICRSILCIPLGICFYPLIKWYFLIYINKIKTGHYSCTALQPTWDSSALRVSRLPLRALSPSSVTINLTLAAAQQRGWARDAVNKEGRATERRAFHCTCHGIIKSADAHDSGCLTGNDWTLAGTRVHEEAVNVKRFRTSVWT